MPVSTLPRIPADADESQLVATKRDLARTAPDPQLVIVLRAAGWRSDVVSQLHALEALGWLLGQQRGAA